jgi:hypothetical protein
VARWQDDWERTPPVARVFYGVALVALLLSFVVADLAVLLTALGFVSFVVALVLQVRTGRRR